MKIDLTKFKKFAALAVARLLPQKVEVPPRVDLAYTETLSRSIIKERASRAHLFAQDQFIRQYGDYCRDKGVSVSIFRDVNDVNECQAKLYFKNEGPTAVLIENRDESHYLDIGEDVVFKVKNVLTPSSFCQSIPKITALPNGNAIGVSGISRQYFSGGAYPWTAHE